MQTSRLKAVTSVWVYVPSDDNTAVVALPSLQLWQKERNRGESKSLRSKFILHLSHSAPLPLHTRTVGNRRLQYPPSDWSLERQSVLQQREISQALAGGTLLHGCAGAYDLFLHLTLGVGRKTVYCPFLRWERWFWSFRTVYHFRGTGLSLISRQVASCLRDFLSPEFSPPSPHIPQLERIQSH
jgi:hypothetical protein